MLDKTKLELLDFYNQGLEKYKNREFSEAHNLFENALKIVPTDGPSRLYKERCESYMENPPGEDWDGVFVMTTK